MAVCHTGKQMYCQSVLDQILVHTLFRDRARWKQGVWRGIRQTEVAWYSTTYAKPRVSSV